MAKKETRKTYFEPVDYFPKEIRKKYGLGEYAKSKDTKQATPKKKTVKRK